MNSELTANATITYHFSVPAEDVFDAWLDTYMIGRFMFGPEVRDEEIVSLKTDAREGGSFSFLVKRENAEIDHVGDYTEIKRPLRLSFTWAVRDELPDTSLIAIDIIPSPTGADLTLTQEMPANWEHYVDDVKSSWLKMLTALDKIL